MEEFIKIAFSKLGPNFTLMIGLAAVIAFFLPPLTRIVEIFADIRLGKRKADIEKTRLEIMKLRYEIEVLKKQHSLAPILEGASRPNELAAITRTIEGRGQPTASITMARSKDIHDLPWRWLVWLHGISPIIASAAAYALLVVFGFLSILFTLGMIGVLTTVSESGQPQVGLLVFMVFFGSSSIGMIYIATKQRAKLRNLRRKTDSTGTQQTAESDAENTAGASR